jgi:hypothetical protein
MSTATLLNNSDNLAAILEAINSLPEASEVSGPQAKLEYDEETKTLHITTDEG